MIVTEGPVKFDEDLKKVTPWWDVVSQYLIAAMMAIALTSTAVQLTKDNLICIPAIDCSHITGQNNHTKLPAVNVSQDTDKICQSLTTKSLKKTVLTKMVDRRFYDYVDSVCYQDLCWFTRFFPLIIFVQTVLLLVCHLLWTKLPFSSSILNHFVVLANEAYSSFGTLDNILKAQKEENENRNQHASSSTRSDSEPGSREQSDNESARLVGSPPAGSQVNTQQREQNDNAAGLKRRPIMVSEDDALKVETLAEKAEQFRLRYTETKCDGNSITESWLCWLLSKLRSICCKLCSKSNPFCCCSSLLYILYMTRVVFQILICLASIIINSIYFSSSFPTTKQCNLDKFVFPKEYDHFECSYPLAPYFEISLILFLIPLCSHLFISFIASIITGIWCTCCTCCICSTCIYRGSYTFKDKTENHGDLAFLFFLLKQHNELYADQASRVFFPGTKKDVSSKIDEIIDSMRKK